MIELFNDLGAGLDLNLYREAALHHCSPDSCVERIEVFGTNGHTLGTQEQCLLNAETALLESVQSTPRLCLLENQYGGFLRTYQLHAIQWINITRSVVSFKAICR